MATLKKIALAATIAASTFGAHATLVNLGAVNTSTPLAVGGSALFPGPFIDYFTFGLPANSGSAYTFSNFALLGPQYNSILIQLSLIANPDGILFNGDDSVVASSVTPGGNSLSLQTGALSAGNYYLDLVGLNTGTVGGIYNGAVAAAPVGSGGINFLSAFGGLQNFPSPFINFHPFTLPETTGSGYAVTNFTSLGLQYNTILSQLSLIANPDGILFNGDDSVVASSVTPGGNSLSLHNGALSAGNYYLDLIGLNTGTVGGIYNGAIAGIGAAPAGIPEPATLALLSLGLAGIGFSRRKH